MFYVYLLRSLKDESFYIGQTKNLKQRLILHNKGNVISTSKKVPWNLLGYEEYHTRNESRYREYVLKHDYSQKKKFIKKLISP